MSNLKTRLDELEASLTKSGKLYTGFVVITDEDEQPHNAQRLNDGYTMEDLGSGFIAWKSPTNVTN